MGLKDVTAAAGEATTALQGINEGLQAVSDTSREVTAPGAAPQTPGLTSTQGVADGRAGATQLRRVEAVVSDSTQRFLDEQQRLKDQLQQLGRDLSAKLDFLSPISGGEESFSSSDRRAGLL